MKERPILFSGPMVRAILDGTKTQTRRVVKPQPIPDSRFVGGWKVVGKGGEESATCSPLVARHSLYGQPGDRLWVREAWRIGAWDEHRPAFALDYCDGPRKEWVDVPDPMSDDDLFSRLWQQSIYDAIKAHGCKDRYQWEPGQSPCRWRPSIHMPRWASRITLEVTGVRVERLQEISEADSKAEGAAWAACSAPQEGSHKAGFATLWESINGSGSWEANPWVWVVEFRRVEGGAA